MSLETRGERPPQWQRSALAKYIQIELDRMVRMEFSKQLLSGNGWSGWLENGNPHGEPRPGPIAEPQGILFLNNHKEK
jgi:hypothetical protein